MKLKKLLMVLSTMIAMIAMSFTPVYAGTNWVYCAGTTHNGINTVEDVNDACNAYSNAGYNGYSHVDPTYSQLSSHVARDVVFFATHGSLTSISFENSGIRVGSNSGNYVGTDTVDWATSDTLLVTYATCNSAGTNGNYSSNSIATATANRGADVVVGFRDTINDGSARNWSKRYNDKLGEGSGVYDAISYANSFVYLFPSVKQVHICHHGDNNIKIGRYRNILVDNDERNILNEPIQIGNTRSNTAIIDIMKEVIPNFKEENYEIQESGYILSQNIDNNESSTGHRYIDFQLKIGDFYTESGYTLKIKDNIIEAIYDNNINSEIQNEALTNENNFKVNDENELLLNVDSINSEIIESEKIESKYFYDIEEEKKYVVFSIPESKENGDKSFKLVKYEI